MYHDKKFFSIEQIFQLLIVIKERGGVTKRMISLITNLIQKKAENWEERFFRGDGPKKLNQIQQEHNKQQDAVDERAEKNYNTRAKNYNDSYYQKRYDDNKQSNYEEVLYVPREDPLLTAGSGQKRKRKQTYDGLLAHDIEQKFKEMNLKLDTNRQDPTDSGSKEYGQV